VDYKLMDTCVKKLFYFWSENKAMLCFVYWMVKYKS
jgi:hypothetical protein